jgi:hypothetical protein
VNCFVPSPPHSFERLLFTPAAGYRSHETGALNVVGAYGYAWSSSTFASGNFDAGHLRFFESEVTPVHGFYRALGFPVRCVQASAREVAFFLLYMVWGT